VDTGGGEHRSRSPADQFVVRTCALGKELGVEGVTTAEAEAIYVARSLSVHGEFVPVESGSPESARLAALQQLAASTLRRAIESDEFVERFRSTDAVREWYPV
jgi:hypothetical protein